MLENESAVEWIEANIDKIVAACGGTIGATSRHRFAQYMFEGLAHNYAGPINREHVDHQNGHEADSSCGPFTRGVTGRAERAYYKEEPPF